LGLAFGYCVKSTTRLSPCVSIGVRIGDRDKIDVGGGEGVGVVGEDMGDMC
jgi:hypothetical protein